MWLCLQLYWRNTFFAFFCRNFQYNCVFWAPYGEMHETLLDSILFHFFTSILCYNLLLECLKIGKVIVWARVSKKMLKIVVTQFRGNFELPKYNSFPILTLFKTDLLGAVRKSGNGCKKHPSQKSFMHIVQWRNLAQ